MQNSNTILAKNSALSGLVSNATSSKSEVNAVSAVESTNSFQHMFSQQLQQEQTNSAANQKQINQTQTNQNLANQQANMKAQEANAERARVAQANSAKQANDNAATRQANNLNHTTGEKADSVATQSSTQPSKSQKSDETNKTADASVKDTAKDADDTQKPKASAGKKITNADLVADLKLAKSKTKPDDEATDEAAKDEIGVTIATQDTLPQDPLQAATLAAAQLAAQKNTAELTKPVDVTATTKTGSDLAGTGGSKKLAQLNQADASPNQAAADPTLDQGNLNSLGEKADVTKQAWLDGVMGKAAQANAGKQAGGFAENLAEKALQANTQLNAQSKGTEQLATPVSMSSVNAYQTTANALNAAGAANGAGNYIAASPGKSGWDQAISQKVVWMVGSGEQSATLNLNPPDLGPLQVVINVNNDKADTTFISQNVEVRKALEEGMSTLRDMMGQAGVELGQANVSTNSQAQQNFEQASRQTGRSTADTNSSNQAPEQLRNSVAVVRVANGLVDTFA
ncbi:MAG TPA: flagellar hook-length control protein FliK [Methylophilaceae bacterium]|jgi:flagellar hook-length control protein FliK